MSIFGFIGSALTDIVIRSLGPFKIILAYILCIDVVSRRAFVIPAIVALTFARAHRARRASSLT
jgi:hypothetical protein